MRWTRLIAFFVMNVMLFVFAYGTAVSIEYAYDAKGRLLSVSYDNEDVVTYNYDATGNRTLFRYDSGIIVSVPDYLTLADFDGNEIVDGKDLALLRAGFREEQGSVCYSTSFDITDDSIVDTDDILMWYSICPDTRWLPGDWTGQGWIEHSDFTAMASDHTVDFWDLVVLGQFWGEDISGLPYCEFLDLVPGDNPGFIHENDLSSFAASWSEARGPVPAHCINGDEDPIVEYEIPQGDRTISAQSSVLESSDMNSAYIDIMLLDPSPELKCFQFILDADVPLDQTLRDADDTQCMILGSVEEIGQGACFMSWEEQESGWLITGAYLDSEPRIENGLIILCSLKIPKYLGTREFRISEVRYAENDGDILATASWSGQVASDTVPQSTCLIGNYPNPFNPTTNIQFGLAHDSHVKLCIYDLSGRLVQTLFDEDLPAGWHEQIWLGRDDRGVSVSSGVYFLHMTGDGQSLNHKLILVH